MRLPFLACLVLLPTTASAQFESERPLISKADSNPLPGIPLDGIWTRQTFVGEGNKYVTTVDGGFLDLPEHDRVHWEEGGRTYRGIHRGRSYRVWPLGQSRTLFERDQDATYKTRAILAEWTGGDIHLFEFETGPGSAFAQHMQAKGVRVNAEGVVDGDRGAILGALRTLPLGRRELESRRRRPTHDEMGLIWNYFEIERWVDEQNNRLAKVERALKLQQRIGALHLAHKLASNARYSDLAHIDLFSIDAFEFGRVGKDDLERLYARAGAALEVVEPLLEKRMEWLSGKIEVLSHEEYQSDPDNPWDFVRRPFPGHLLEFHVTAKRTDGTVIVDTRAQGQPWQAPVMGELPEGIQYGLRILGFEEKITLRIPPQLAFGAEQGEVDVSLEIVRGLPDGATRPSLEGVLAIKVAPVEAEETPSGLRYRDLAVGEGATPKRGDRVELRFMAWSAMNRTLEEMHVEVAELGSDDVLAGVNEGVASMKVGGRRILFIPRHLADQRPERSGMAQCVGVELMSIKE